MANAAGVRFAHAPPEVAPGTRHFWAVAWALLRRRSWHILYIGGALFLIDFLRIWPQFPDNAAIWSRFLPEVVLTHILGAAKMVVFITLAQALPLAGWHRAVAMVAAGLLAMLAHVALGAALALYTTWSFLVQTHVVASLASYLMSVAWEWSTVAIALALFYVVQEREMLLASRARDSELERVEKQRAVMESRLAVMRARVEPEFLFGALDEVRDLYGRNPGAAADMVDALIAYLRAALPQMRGGGSTIRREADLACAYVAVLQVPRGEALSVDEDIGSDVEDVVLPPMVLLPLTQAAFASGDAGLRRTFAIDATHSAAGVSIVVSVEGGSRPDAWRGLGPETARRTLAAYFGASAELHFGTEASRHWAQVVLPHEAVVRHRTES